MTIPEKKNSSPCEHCYGDHFAHNCPYLAEHWDEIWDMEQEMIYDREE